MTTQEADKIKAFIDTLVDGEDADLGKTSDSEPDQPQRELPKDKRVVRTKTSGDRVYYLDDVKKTRQWVTNPDVLKSLGFELSDVVEVTDMDLLKYQMGAALYRVDQNV